jgi:hypothetical protein
MFWRLWPISGGSGNPFFCFSWTLAPDPFHSLNRKCPGTQDTAFDAKETPWIQSNSFLSESLPFVVSKTKMLLWITPIIQLTLCYLYKQAIKSLNCIFQQFPSITQSVNHSWLSIFKTWIGCWKYWGYVTDDWCHYGSEDAWSTSYWDIKHSFVV